MFEQFVAPLSGRLISLEQVPDAVFAGKLMGEGFAVDPSGGDVVSPVDGKVVAIMPESCHAIGIVDDDGNEILIHIGIDTVQLAGEGFANLVELNDCVKAGQPLIKVDWEGIRSKAPSLISPVVFVNLPEGVEVRVTHGAQVKQGDKNFFQCG